MHDLDLIQYGERFGVVEVTAAADAESLELWKLLNNSDERWIEPTLAGGWTVSLLPSARAKQLRTRIPIFLAELERLGIKEVQRRYRTDRLDAVLSELGIVTAHQGETDSQEASTSSSISPMNDRADSSATQAIPLRHG